MRFSYTRMTLIISQNKKLEAFVRDYGKHAEEKKLKKIPEEIVSVVMRQYGASLIKEFPEKTILGKEWRSDGTVFEDEEGAPGGNP